MHSWLEGQLTDTAARRATPGVRSRGGAAIQGFPASAQSAGVCSGLTRRGRTCKNRSRLEGRFPEVAVDAHGTALGAGALGFASGEVVAKAR
jgi:hypothetical protein